MEDAGVVLTGREMATRSFRTLMAGTLLFPGVTSMKMSIS